MGKTIELIAADGFQLSAYRAEPEGDPRGDVVVAQEIFGVNSHIKSVCDGFAKDGYVAIARGRRSRSRQRPMPRCRTSPRPGTR
jgi:carboxymethylenebutenolidase